ncbi:MAG: Asp-tRNA(Asn)/Glu-tRNA(Gln) amidotransferase subunit GatA [Patescibacteria group bacterium]
MNEVTIKEAIDGLKSKAFTSYGLTNACLAQIDAVDTELKAFITVLKEEALEQAKVADKVIDRVGSKAFDTQPLLGIPYACKDNFSTKGIKTTASSKMLENYIPPFESTVTKKLKEAGAVLLGKTNMDAFAHGSSTETSDFFRTKNPHDQTRSPGGSSGGSACAVASNMCVFAIGSETAGSLRGPASWCGIVGLKPTYGRVSRYGLIAMASSTDSPGPLTKTVYDGAYVLKVIAGKDTLDATTSPAALVDYLPNAFKSLQGIRIGRPKSYFEVDLEPEVKKNAENFINLLKNSGAEIVDVDLLSPKYSIAVYTVLQRSEVSSNLARLDGIRYGNNRTNFGAEAKNRMMLGAYTLSVGYYDEYYAKAQKVRTLIVDDFKNALSKVDLVVAPSMPSTALKIGESQRSPIFGELMDVLSEPSSIAGLPAISLPFGVDDKNLPIGVQFIGPQFSEKRIVDVASCAEELCK